MKSKQTNSHLEGQMRGGNWRGAFSAWESEEEKRLMALPLLSHLSPSLCRQDKVSFLITFFSRVLRDSTPRFVSPSIRRSIGPLVRRSVCQSVCHTLLLLGFCGGWPHSSCSYDQVTSNMAPAHPHATGVAVYPALFFVSVSHTSSSLYLCALSF